MFKHVIWPTLLITNLLIVNPAQADYANSSHHCRSPQKPHSGSDFNAMTRFFDEVVPYAQCLSDFIRTHQDAITQHQTAIKQAERRIAEALRTARRHFYNSNDAKQFNNQKQQVWFATNTAMNTIRSHSREIKNHQSIIDQTAEKYSQLF